MAVNDASDNISLFIQYDMDLNVISVLVPEVLLILK